MKLPILIFDLGGVLIRIQYRRFFETLGLDHVDEGKHSLSLQDEAALLGLQSGDLQSYESGRVSTKEFFDLLQHGLKRSFDLALLYAAWHAVLAGEVDGMHDLVRQLSKQVPLYLLSNTNELHFEYAKKKFQVLHLFKHHFVSYKIGAMKPSREIFHHVVRTLGKRPEELLFIDDMEKNVMGARDVGIQGELFTGVDVLKEPLREIGFKV